MTNRGRTWAGGSRRRNLAWCLIAMATLLPAEGTAQTQADLGQLDAYIAAAREDWSVPGLAVAIVRGGEVVLARGYGVRHIEQSDPVDEHTLFAIASNTKAFTAAALAKLVDEDRIDWNDRVVSYLSYFQLYDPYVTQEMRVRDLLCHRSGLGTFSGDLLWYGTTYSREDVVRRARFLEQAGAFRASYGYSNIMFLAAGEIVPAVTGRSWDEFVRTEFFQPIGMNRTYTSVDSLAGMANVATPHAEQDGAVLPFPWYDWDNIAPAGGIISSVSDMARWLQLQLNRGVWNGDTLLSERAFRTIWTPHVSYTVSRSFEERYPSTHFRGYGLGWGLMDYLGRKVVMHGGAYDGMFSRVALVPEEDLGFVVLTNSATGLPGALMYRILDAYLGGEERDWSTEALERTHRSRQRRDERRGRWEAKRVPDTQPSLPLEAYAGTYSGKLYGDATVSVEEDQLVVRFHPAPDLVGDLTHWHFDAFKVEWRHAFPWFGEGIVQFVMDATGNVVEMKVDVPNEDFWFYELEFKKKE